MDWWGVAGMNATLKTRYVTSMYGIFNALENGFTDSEKVFGIIAELIVGSVIYGGLAAVLLRTTNLSFPRNLPLILGPFLTDCIVRSRSSPAR